MGQYKIEFFDEDGSSARSLDIDCWDDAEAINLATTLIRSCERTELWKGDRYIGKVPPLSASSTQLTIGRTRNLVFVDPLGVP